MVKWKPKEGQRYWYIDGTINWLQIQVCQDTWDEEVEEEWGNCFRTRKEAKTALKKILRILR